MLRREDRWWFHHHVLVPLKSSSTGSPIHDDDVAVVCLKLWLKSNPFLASVIVTAEPEPPQSLNTQPWKKHFVDHVESEKNNSIFCVIKWVRLTELWILNCSLPYWSKSFSVSSFTSSCCFDWQTTSCSNCKMNQVMPGIMSCHGAINSDCCWGTTAERRSLLDGFLF